MLKTMYTNANGLMEELEFKDQVAESKLDIVCTVETKLGKIVKSHVVFPEAYMIILKYMKVFLIGT